MDNDVKYGDKFIRRTGHVYTVKNQNGLNNALYDYFSTADDGSGDEHFKQKVRKMVQNVPPYYPITIVIIDQSFECSRVYLEFFNIEEEAHKCSFQ